MSSSASRKPRSLFIGLCTLDVMYSVDRMPGSNEKVIALRQAIAAGGPATNAAIAFAYLGGQASLLSSVGNSPLSAVLRRELSELGVELIDVSHDLGEMPPISAVMVTAHSGDRALVASNISARVPRAHTDLHALVGRYDALLIDGHYPELTLPCAHAAQRADKLSVLDAGRWEPSTPELLSYIDVMICSADFHPPGTTTPQEALEYLVARGTRWIAVTRGEEPVLWAGSGTQAHIAVPQRPVVDTLGAGDVFHGAFVYEICRLGRIGIAEFKSALTTSCEIASTACTSFGTRGWMRGSCM